MSDTELRAELTELLVSYLRGSCTIADFIAWEGDHALRAGIGRQLRGDLDRLALLGEEVVDGIRPEADFRALAETYSGGAASQRRQIAR